MSDDVAESAQKRLAFQKSYSIEHGTSWRRRSLIEDAKFDTVTNAEFERKEKCHERRSESISEEEEEVFSDVGIPETDVNIKVSLIVGLKDGASALAKLLHVFETTQVNLLHMETRAPRKPSLCLEVLMICDGRRNGITTLANALRQVPAIASLIVRVQKEADGTVIWFPKHISELDRCTHIITKFEPELDTDHPGFTDKIYRDRRKQIADIAFDYRHGQPIPRIAYNDDEISAWGAVYRQLKSMFATHACREHADLFEVLERECGYSETNIPQLQDVSDFLKRHTGFSLRPVSGLLSARDFLASLAFRVFQCTQYVRHSSKPDHSPEPDCVHELMGHVPMLADPSFAQFSQEMGLLSLGVSDADIIKFATLYWFTVEFGIVRQNGELRAYGAGILSSFGELKHAISDSSEKQPFIPELVAVQQYQDINVQPLYFVTESFEDMKEKMRHWANKLRRPYEVRYNPFTQSLQLLDNRYVIHEVTAGIKSDLACIERAVDRLQNIHIHCNS